MLRVSVMCENGTKFQISKPQLHRLPIDFLHLKCILIGFEKNICGTKYFFKCIFENIKTPTQ